MPFGDCNSVGYLISSCFAFTTAKCLRVAAGNQTRVKF